MSNSEKQLVIEDTKERKKEFLKICLILAGRVKHWQKQVIIQCGVDRCSIGDFGTIYYFQIIDHSLSIYVDVACNSKWFNYKHYIRNHNSNENFCFCWQLVLHLK